jgi:hypothetical protein
MFQRLFLLQLVENKNKLLRSVSDEIKFGGGNTVGEIRVS